MLNMIELFSITEIPKIWVYFEIFLRLSCYKLLSKYMGEKLTFIVNEL